VDQEIRFGGRSSVIRAAHSTVVPAGPGTFQCVPRAVAVGFDRLDVPGGTPAPGAGADGAK
jgi:hypothetical protein